MTPAKIPLLFDFRCVLYTTAESALMCSARPLGHIEPFGFGCTPRGLLCLRSASATTCSHEHLAGRADLLR